jgi:hypothetical protein
MVAVTACLGGLAVVALRQGGRPPSAGKPNDIQARTETQPGPAQAVAPENGQKRPEARLEGLAPSGESRAERLMAFLKAPPPAMTRQVYGGEVEHALAELDALDPLPESVCPFVLDLARDRSAPPVVRDYALQHLQWLYRRQARGGNGAAWVVGPQAEEIRSAWWDATNEPEGTYAGTALLALDALAGDFKEVNAARVTGRALEIARDGKMGAAARTSALQVCARRGETGVVETALAIAGQPGAIPLRASALAALGALGDAKTLAWLESLAAAPVEKGLQPAVESALRNLRNRHSNTGAQT